MKLTRTQVLAHRVLAQQFYRELTDPRELDVLSIGVQEAMGHPAALAYAARLATDVELGPDAVRYGPGEDLALVWSLRGAPHVHRRDDLDDLAAALWPLSESDAAARLNESGPAIERAGVTALEQFGAAVEAMRAVVTSKTPKGAASTAVSKRIPPAMRHECRACKTSHISDSAMRVAALPAGLELEPDTAPPVLTRRRGAKRPQRAAPAKVTRLARDYLRLLGPAGPGEFAGYLEARRADVAPVWPDDLVEVAVDGRKAWVLPEHVDALGSAPKAELVRLLGPFDPYLQARDRDLLVPDKGRHKALWPTLGRPGALMVDGEITGVWRTRSARTKLTITLEPFTRLPASAWKKIEAEAERVAAVRGAADVEVKRAE